MTSEEYRSSSDEILFQHHSTIPKKPQKGVCLFIFRRDLRIHDNLAFQAALKRYERVLPIFIFVPEQIEPEINQYYGKKAVKFMMECLIDLSNCIKLEVNTAINPGRKLTFFYGDNVRVIREILDTCPEIKSIAFNQDYSVYARQRD